MNVTLKNTDKSVPSLRVKPKKKRTAFWDKWGIWLAIVGGIILLFSFGDAHDFARGFRDGYADSGTKHPLSTGALIIGGIIVLLGITLLIAMLSGVSHLYYRFFHQHVFKKSQVAYTVLYIVCLLLLWNAFRETMIGFFKYSAHAGDKIDKREFNEMFAAALAAFLLIYLILYGFIVDYRKSRKLQTSLVQQRTQAELDALKAQVNPHFLFNSLNNIYGTAIQEDSPRTAESIQQLSGIVRYVMEESRLQTTDIRRELRFIDDFVELQRLRLPNLNNIDIQTNIEWDEKPAQIVPLLLNPLIENAFKYGISMQHPCFVHVSLRVQNGLLHFVTENSILPRTELEKGTGLGLANVRQRLDLAYPDRHTLLIEESDSTYRITLTINL